MTDRCSEPLGNAIVYPWYCEKIRIICMSRDQSGLAIGIFKCAVIDLVSSF